jgi:putative ATPase
MTDLFSHYDNGPTTSLPQRAHPSKLEDYVGLDRLLDENPSLRGLFHDGRPFQIVLYGPPGVGKTTLARLLSQSRDFIELSAATATIKELRDKLEVAKKRTTNSTLPALCFIDEIHRFTKVQQDVLLEPLEEGIVSFIFATTENPFVTLTPALLSRVRCIELPPISPDALREILKRAAEVEQIIVSDTYIDEIIAISDGDARAALKVLEEAIEKERALSLHSAPASITIDTNSLNLRSLKLRRARTESSHYELASALIKSIRASKRSDALYYLARLIVEDEDPRFIARRLAIFASEDIGPINNQALAVANSTFSLLEKVGMPEGKFLLAHCVIYLCDSPKSTSVKDLINEAISIAQRSRNHRVPKDLRGSIADIERRYQDGE